MNVVTAITEALARKKIERLQAQIVKLEQENAKLRGENAQLRLRAFAAERGARVK